MGGSAWRGALLVAMLLGPGGGLLAQTRAWTITPSIGLRGTYTDNASLAATPERGEFVTDIYPSISINTRGRRFNANASYTAHALFYAREREQDRLANLLSGSANLEAIERFFFVDGTANVNQSYLSPFAPRPTDITTVTTNRIETRTFSLSPYVRSRTAGGYTYEVRNRNTWTSTDNSILPKIHTREWSSSLASPIRLFGWSVDANKTNISYDDPLSSRPERDSSIARGHVFFQPQSSLRLSATAGRESNNFIAQEERSNSTYGYGALWRPTPRTSTQLDWERRFFGVSKLASFEHRTPLTAWNASYSKSASTYQQELLRLPPGNTAELLDAIFRARIPDPVQRAQAVDQFLRTTGTPGFLSNSLAFFSEQVFLLERLQGSFAILGVRNSITFTAFRARSTALTEPPPGLPEAFLASGSRVKQRGFGAAVNHRLTGFTSLGVSANRMFAEEEESGTESRNDYLTLNLNHSVSPKTDTFAGLSYTRFEPIGAPASNARMVFAGLQHRF